MRSVDTGRVGPVIYLDVTRLVGRALKGRLPTGVDRVGLAYVAHFGARAGAVVRLLGRAIVLAPGPAQPLFQALLAGGARRFALLWPLALAALRGGGGGRLRGARLFNTGHSGLELPGYGPQLLRQQARPWFVVHDLIPISHPEYCRAGERVRHEHRMRVVLRQGSGVIANSRATLDALARFASATGQAMPPAVVAPLAPASLPPPAPQRPLAAPYFVMLGTIEPRKNHILLLQLWRTLVERMGDGAPRLVLIGQRGWECDHVYHLLQRCPALAGAVQLQAACSDAELATYLHHSQALLFPSFAEGYGLPLVEALAAGVPVIASDLPAFREVAGDGPDYLDPLDGPGWLAHIVAYAAPAAPARAAQLARIAGYRAPTWAAHFRAVEQLMEQLP